AQQSRAVSETPTAEMVVADLDHQSGFERLPLGRAFGRPAARPTRLVAGKAGRRDQFFEPFGQRFLFLGLERGGEADMIEQSRIVVEAEQQRADDALALVIAEAADHAVRAAEILDLLHAVPIAALVGDVAPL